MSARVALSVWLMARVYTRPMLRSSRRNPQASGAAAECQFGMPLCYLRVMAELDSYIAGWRERWREQQRTDARAARRARRIAERLARLLRDRYGARRVILVGSLARGEFGSGSDIDFAAEGIADEDFFRAGAEIEAAAGGLQVDLVPLESANPAFLAHVAAEGIVLHDASR